MTENTPAIELKVTLSPESAPSGNFFKIDEKMLKEEWCEKETGSGIPKELKVNVVPGSNAESTFDLKLGLEKKRKLFKEEKLSLVCEWAGCGETETNPDIFNWHVAKHCHEAGVAVFCSYLFALNFCHQVQQNLPPLEDCFLCLWMDCGFKTPSSQEMVRHLSLILTHFSASGEACQLPWVPHKVKSSRPGCHVSGEIASMQPSRKVRQSVRPYVQCGCNSFQNIYDML